MKREFIHYLILKTIKANGVITVRGIRRVTGLNFNLIIRELNALEQQKYIESTRIANLRLLKLTRSGEDYIQKIECSFVDAELLEIATPVAVYR